MADLDDIKKLSPEERIRKLKKLEEEKRKEIEEAEKLIKESEGEIEEEEKIRQKIPVPQMKAVDIGNLFTAEEKQIFATKRYQDSRLSVTEEEEKDKKPAEKESTLEDTLWKEQPNLTEQQFEEQRQYGEQLAQEGADQLYQMAKEVYNGFKETGQVDQGKLYALDVAARRKEEEFPGGMYKASSERVEEQFGSAKSIIKYLRGN